MNRTLTPLLLLLLIGVALTSATGQEIEPLVLVGVGKGQKQMEQLIHLYAIDPKIVDTVAKVGTADLDRAFVLASLIQIAASPPRNAQPTVGLAAMAL